MLRFYKNYAQNLPDVYYKKSDGNIWKILEIEREAAEDFRTDLTEVNNALDLANVSGKTLDLYGEMVGQPRGKATDAQYLYMIRAKIARNLSGGDYESVARAVRLTFDCRPEEFYLKESEDAPCTVELMVLPLSVIVHAGLSTRQTVAMIATILPVGVTMKSFLFEGTFCFSDREDEYDENAGFCDREDGTLGGYFGILYGEDDEPILPI